MFNERVLEKMFQSMNAHVPSRRPSLQELLQMEEPSYKGKDENIYHIDREELAYLSQLIEEWEWSKIKIPILLMTDTSYEQGCWKVIGKVEVRLISKIIEREPEKEDEMRLFPHHLRLLRERLPTTTNTMYMP